MRKLPGAIFVVDPNNERIAIQEANVLGIPVVAITDTNCNPDGISYVVPGNDDAIKSVTLLSSYFADAVTQGSKGVKKSATAKETGARDSSLEKEIISKFEKDIDLQGEEESAE